MRRFLTCMIFLSWAAVLAAPVPSGATSRAVQPATDPLPPQFVTHHSPLYNNPQHWLCLPGRKGDSCDVDLDTTVVNADGSTSIERHVAATDPPIDCFYVYPTVSADPTENSDFHPGPEETNAVVNQVARLNSTCRVYAPVYRQVTLAGLFGTAKPNPPGRPTTVAYTDVLDAFEQYVANFSHGRGFILIGHSQGAGMLERLVKEQIDDVPALRARLVSAILIGTTVSVPSKTAVVGGSFQHIPLCRKIAQIGCAMAYSSFRSTSYPPADSFFGRTSSTSFAGCTNPAALGGSAVELHPYFKTSSIHALTNPAANAKITTPWVTLPEFVRGQCVFLHGFSYLRITVQGNPADPRADNIPGDLTPEWGLHLVDMNLTAGDMEKAVAAEAKTYVASAG
jgi:hypothetical protein